MTKFLITGGAGFIGSHIAEYIVEQGLGDVVVFDDLSSGYEENVEYLRDKIQFIKGDVRNSQDVNNACQGVDFVFHKAAFVSAFDSFNKPELTNDINIRGTQNVLEIARQNGVQKVVLASSAAVYGTESELPNSETMLPRPESPYAVSKICNEYQARIFAKHMGLKTVCLRFFNVYGPKQDPSSEYSGVISRFVDKITSGEAPIIYGDGSQTRDFIFVRDVARAVITAAMSENAGGGAVFNIGTGKETSLVQLVDALGKSFEKDIKPEFAEWREGDIKRSVADVTKAEEVFRFKAEMVFEEGIKALVS